MTRRRPDVDWVALRLEYTYGTFDGVRRTWPTFSQLAHKNGLAVRAVTERGKEEDWETEREIAYEVNRDELVSVAKERMGSTAMLTGRIIEAAALWGVLQFVDPQTGEIDQKALRRKSAHEIMELLRVARANSELAMFVSGKPIPIGDQAVASIGPGKTNGDVAPAQLPPADVMVMMAAALDAVLTHHNGKPPERGAGLRGAAGPQGAMADEAEMEPA